jgi:hypothetical protein
LAPAAAGAWTSVNVTSAVTGNGLVSFGLSTTSGTALALSSREGANPPQLIVSGAGATPTPSPTSAPTATPTPTAVPTATPTPTPTPTSTSGTGGSTTFTSVADSYVDASNASVNRGTATSLRVDASPVIRSYLRFNVSGLTGSATSATLRIWANSAQSSGYDVFGVADTTWGETTINDSNAPPFGAKLGSSGAVTSGSWTSVTVTSAVTGNGLISFGLSTTSSTALALSSREGANPPQLVISGPGIALVIGPSQTTGFSQVPTVAYLLVPLLLPGLILLSRPGRRSTILASLRDGAGRTYKEEARRSPTTAA